jgi:hypothetical protein
MAEENRQLRDRIASLDSKLRDTIRAREEDNSKMEDLELAAGDSTLLARDVSTTLEAVRNELAVAKSTISSLQAELADADKRIQETKQFVLMKQTVAKKNATISDLRSRLFK